MFCCCFVAPEVDLNHVHVRGFTYAVVPVVRNLNDEVVSAENVSAESRYASRVSSPVDDKHVIDKSDQKYATTKSVSFVAVDKDRVNPVCSIKNVEFDESAHESAQDQLLLYNESTDSVSAMLKTHRTLDAYSSSPYSGGRHSASGTTTSLARQWRVPKHNKSVYRLAYSAHRSLHSARSSSYIDELTWRANTPLRDHHLMYNDEPRRVKTPGAELTAMQRRSAKARSSHSAQSAAAERLELAYSLPPRERKASLARVAYGSSTPAPTIMAFQPPKPRSGLRRGNERMTHTARRLEHKTDTHTVAISAHLAANNRRALSLLLSFLVCFMVALFCLITHCVVVIRCCRHHHISRSFNGQHMLITMHLQLL